MNEANIKQNILYKHKIQRVHIYLKKTGDLDYILQYLMFGQTKVVFHNLVKCYETFLGPRKFLLSRRNAYSIAPDFVIFICNFKMLNT